MAFFPVEFAYVNAAQEVGVTALSTTGVTQVESPLDLLIDDRGAPSFVLQVIVGGTDGVDIDLDPQGLGPGNFRVGLDRLLIPAGNVLGTNISLVEDDNAGFTTPTLLLDDVAVVSGDLVDLKFAATTQRYIRFLPGGSAGTGTFGIPELVLSQDFVPARGPQLVRAPDQFVFNDTRFQMAGGQSPTLENAPAQRTFRYDYFSAKQPDIAGLDAMIEYVGLSQPVWVSPAAIQVSAPERIWMKFLANPRRDWAVGVPMNGVDSRDYVLDLIQNLD